MYIIGLTGGIASGKSTVSKMLSELGACIIDADKCAHKLMEPYEPAWYAIVNFFGEDILRPDKTIDRNLLGNKIFNDSEARKSLDSITHPIIKNYIEERISEFVRVGCGILVLDVPLLYEVGWQYMVNEVWVVYIERETQIQRLMKRNNLSYEQARARINSQMDLTIKAELADKVIDNSKDINNTKCQVHASWERAVSQQQ
ncbi:dephospho-CoA kinase [Dendrosporobacter sp. 1207_IL3150]|uniref:dephospho-CoA kinase n=1 Tax=Dendrosporobacter sp. 1207_IL3150 TaxID=3084054 RepID=UPI002FDB9314